MKRPERPGGQSGSSSPARPIPRGASPVRKPEPIARTAPERFARGTGTTSKRERTSSSSEARAAQRVRKRYEKAEVKRFTRRARSRRLGWTIAIAIVGVMVALVLTAVYSPILALRDVRVEGTTSLDPAVVASAVSGQLGTPLALLDTARLESDLSRFPTIRSYVTELVPPGTLVIRIAERSPVGVLATGSGFDTVDAAGVVLGSSPTRPAGLPLMAVDADGVDGKGFAAMSQVLVALPPQVLSQVDSVSAQTHDDVTLTLTGSAQRVVWGSADDSPRKARVLAALLARFASSGPGEYDVSAPGSAVFHAD